MKRRYKHQPCNVFPTGLIATEKGNLAMTFHIASLLGLSTEKGATNTNLAIRFHTRLLPRGVIRKEE
jgi:hypothetical protein